MSKEFRNTASSLANLAATHPDSLVTKEFAHAASDHRNTAAGRSSFILAGVSAVLATALIVATTGCGAGLTTTAVPAAKTAFSGNVHGGQQPVAGAHVFLYAVSTAAGGNGQTASQSLLNSPGYVTTDANGGFSITADYTCTPGTYVYLLALGGNPGLTPIAPATTVNNPDLALASGVGACPLNPASFYVINEVTTVATAYALSQFSTSDLQISASSAYTNGLQNAFAVIPNLVDLSNGIARTTTPAGNGYLPTATLNSLANSLAACVNSNGTGAPCNNLMSNTNVIGAGGTPIDTFQAALNISRFPGVDVANIYNDAQANAPFQPALTTSPNDWTLAVKYVGAPNPNLASSPNQCFEPQPNGGPFTDICQAQGIGIDASGNVWITSYNPDLSGTSFEQGSVVEFSPAGAELSPPGGFTDPSFFRLQQIALDAAGNAWTGTRASTVGTTSYPDALVRLSPSGLISEYTGGGITRPRAVAIDAYGNIWTAGYTAATGGDLAEFTSAGVPVSGNGYASANLENGTFKMAFDHLGNAWNITYDIGSNGSGSLIEFTPVSHATNLLGTYGGVFAQAITSNIGAITQGLAIDASNNLWYSNAYGDSSATSSGFVSEYNNNGTLLSGSGYTAGGITTPNVVAGPNDVVIDGLGNVFALSFPNASGAPSIGEISNAGAAIAPATGYQSISPFDCCFTGAIDNSGNLWLTGGVSIYEVIGIANPVVTPIAATLNSGVQANAKP